MVRWGGMNHGGMAMDHSQHAMSAGGLAVPSTTARHARTEYGARTDMRVDMARTNLDDPGIGLRNNGRRVLTGRSTYTFRSDGLARSWTRGGVAPDGQYGALFLVS